MIEKKVPLLVSGFSAILALPVIVIVIVILIYYLRTPEQANSTSPVHVESNKSSVERQTRNAGLAWFGVLPPAAADMQGGASTFGEVITALAASRNPADALQAYQMIEACEANRPVFEIDPTPAAFLPRKKQCATITDLMRRSRYDYLRAAAYAGSPGVGSPWFRYGPSGDMEALRTRPNDPSVIEWKR